MSPASNHQRRLRMMAMFSFYRETTPEPQHHHHHPAPDDEQPMREYLQLQLKQGGHTPPIFGTPIVSPRFHEASSSSSASASASSNELLEKPFEHEFERVQEQERSRRSSRSSVSKLPAAAAATASPVVAVATTDETGPSDSVARPPAAPHPNLPTELWELIFSFLAVNPDDDSYQPLGDLFNCILTCRAWAYLLLPKLYRTHGYGVFMPKPATRDAVPSRFVVSRSINAHTAVAGKRLMQLWRTLLLSCFTASQPTSPSRFTTFKGATLFPYIKYVEKLDARTLVMVLSEIMKTRRYNTEENNNNTGYSMDEKPPRSTEAADYFFAGALGAFEISGAARGERMIVGGPEFEMRTPVWGKEVKLFVGDTALMMMDFLYPHLHHLKGFTVPELGQLRVSPPITMHHPVSLLTSLTALNSLVISSGWMVTLGLGRAIASIRPTLTAGSNSKFNLTVLDWRFKTHYDPNYTNHKASDDFSVADEADCEEYRYTSCSVTDFFGALNPNSITSLDLDFEVRYTRQQQGDLGDGSAPVRQAKSLEALRIAHLRCDAPKLLALFHLMVEAGFAPKSLSLVELYFEQRHVAPSGSWNFAEGIFANLEDLELVRFTGMFDLFQTGKNRQQCFRPIPPTRSLKLSYTQRHVEEARRMSTSVEYFFLHHLPCLANTLTTLKLCDTEYAFDTRTEPRWRVSYSEEDGGMESSPLEYLVNLRTLVLTGDISLFLLRNRLPQILSALKNTLTTCDLCFSIPSLHSQGQKLQSFLVCNRLENLYLREWNWDVDEVRHTHMLLRTEDVKSFVERCRMDAGGGVLKELGVDGGLLQVAGWQNWGEVQKWVEERGCRFYYSPGQMWKVGYVKFSGGRDPTFT